MIVPALVLIGSLWGGKKIYHALKKRPMKPSEQRIFEEAYHNLRSPEKLRELAAEYRANGFEKEANLLEQRASLREMPASEYRKLRGAFDKAMSSKNPQKVREMAKAFEARGAVGAAAGLRTYADTLEAP